jgi:hypothetical protein
VRYFLYIQPGRAQKLKVQVQACIFSDAQKVLQANEYICTLFMYSSATVPIDSVFVVYRGPKKKLKIKEINGSQVSKRKPSENGP